MNKFNRRDFLKLGAASIIGSGVANFPNLSFAQSAFSDYKALVCVFLHGGNDGFNLIVPTDANSYSEYANSRQNLAVESNLLLPISPLSNDGHTYGLHPSAAPLQSLFDDGKMAIVRNTGHLIEPVTRAQILDNSANLPTELFSHNNQQNQWKTINTNPLSTSGWGGRLANLFATQQSEPLLTGISVDDRSLWLSHPDTQDLSISANGFNDYWYVDQNDNGSENKRRTAYLENLYRAHNKEFNKGIAGVQQRTLELVESIGSTLSASTPISTVFPEGSRIASRLKQVANMIGSREALGMHRQVFFVEMGGFDTHDTQNRDQAELFNMLSTSLKAFYDALTEIGVAGDVTTFTASEFGRTLTSNGDGTDHGWGSNHLVIGDAVRGGDMYGAMPSLAIEGADDSGRRGRIIPTTSVEQYVHSMLQWYGLDSTQINTVLPNAGAFNINAVNLML